jgi:hypothetical protein
MWVLEDWWPTIRDLTLYWEFCSVRHSKRQYERCNKIIYGLRWRKKRKSHEDSLELRSLYFIWVLGAPCYQWGYIGWVGEVQILESYPQTKNPSGIGHIQNFDWISETFARHLWPPVRTSPGLSSSLVTKSWAGLIWPLARVLVTFPGDIWPQARACPAS